MEIYYFLLVLNGILLFVTYKGNSMARIVCGIIILIEFLCFISLGLPIHPKII